MSKYKNNGSFKPEMPQNSVLIDFQHCLLISNKIYIITYVYSFMVSSKGSVRFLKYKAVKNHNYKIHPASYDI